MDKSCDFLLGSSDEVVTGLLKALPEVDAALDRRFNQEEEFFLVLEKPYVVEPFEVHHDSVKGVPSSRYLEVIRSLVKVWGGQVPGVFRGMSWFFTPQDLFHPLFVQVVSFRDKRFLHVLRADITFRGRSGEVLERGTNDVTPRFRTDALFLEALTLPLETWESEPDHKRLYLGKLFDSTWKGESGRGYQRAGWWIDQEITRLLSRAALAPGTKTFPHYPLRCAHGTLAVRTPTPTVEGRKRSALALATAWPLVSPLANTIGLGLWREPFHEDHPLIAELRGVWGGKLEGLWGDYRLEAYLNTHDQKEYRYHGL